MIARTAQGRVTADRAIVAADAFIETLLPQLARYIAPVESYIVATAPLSARQRRTMLPQERRRRRHALRARLLPALRRRPHAVFRRRAVLSATRDDRATRDIASLVRPRMEFVFPQLKGIAIDYAWGGTVGITRTRLPHFGRVGERVSFGYGYSGQGVALANMGGKALAGAAMGKKRGVRSAREHRAERVSRRGGAAAAAGGDDAGGHDAARPVAVTRR